MNSAEQFAAALRLHQAGQLAAAEAGYRGILAVEPGQAGVHYNLGLVLRSRGALEDAAAAYAEALRLQPQFPAAANNLGAVLERLGRLDDAEQWLRLAVRDEPGSAPAWSNLGGVLKDLARFDEAMACHDRAIALQSDNPRFHSNRIVTLNYGPADDPAVLHRAARAWQQRFATPLAAGLAPHGNDRSPERRLRLGYVSANFREHSDARFTVPLFAGHNRADFAVFAYSGVTAPDAVTAKLRGGVDEWRETAGLSDADLAGLIRRDRIDVLVDLTLHMANDQLLVFARQPAPVQVSWLGYPGSTGLEAVSAEFTDPWLSPREDATGEAEDRFERLPDCFWCYDPGATEPPVGPLPAERNGFVTWGCLNNFCKVTDETLAMWAEVMRLVPDSRLILLAPPGSARARVLGRLGVEAGRVEFVGYQPRADYLKVYQRIDLGLDTFPYTGHTTSLDALWMGVPLVSRAGRTAVSRGSLSVLGNLGLNGLVADTREQFARIAVEWAGQPERLSALHTGLRERLIRSPVMDGARFARNFEQACRSRWRRWCRGGAATGAGIRPLGGESG